MIHIEPTGIYRTKNTLSLKNVANLITRLKKQGKRVGLCQGGFDLLHPGHIKHFESAKKLCDVLFVSITSDQFVTRRKGSGRPIFADKLRAYMVASLRMVDYVVITDLLGVDVLHTLKPSLYIKGSDFIGKQTPGITAERRVAKIAYTKDPKLSTTEVIDYIQKSIPRREILVVVDRDGTLIKNKFFFGKDDDWRKKLRLNMPVVSFLSYLKTKYKTTMIVASNQSGVARGYFSESRVREIHNCLDKLLKKQGATIENWQHAPDVDREHAQANFIPRYIKSVTKRKPSVAMVNDALKELGKKLNDFSKVVVLGDRHEDAGLAQNLGAHFIDVKGKSYDKLLMSL